MKYHLLFWVLILPSILTNCKTAKFTANNELAACKSTGEMTGANFLFLIDNSGSMYETDCTNPDSDGVCSGPTEREKAILASFDRLTELASNSKDPNAANSVFTIAKFSPDTRNGTLADISSPVYAQFETKKENRAELERALSFTRRPRGDTPFQIAVEYTQRFLNEQSNKKRNVAVLLTDGEPTDVNPKSTLSSAMQLPLDRYSIRINTKGQSINERYIAHKKIIESHYTPDENSWRTQGYDNIEAYMNDLLALAENFSSAGNIDIQSAKDLETAIFDNVIVTTVNSCDN